MARVKGGQNAVGFVAEVGGGALVLWCFVLNPHRGERETTGHEPFALTRAHISYTGGVDEEQGGRIMGGGGADIERSVRDEVEQRLEGVELHQRGRSACHTPKSTVEAIKRGNQARYISHSGG